MLEQSYFYTVEPKYILVSQTELANFINNYPRPLQIDVTGITEPPLVSYNDFELANRWPYSIVAKHYVYDDRPQDYYYESPERREYYIMENYEEVFASKTGNMAGEGE